VEDTLRPDRLVFGVQGSPALEILEQVYSIPLTEATPVVRCDLATAELIKTAANAFLATKISFINAMAQMCQAAGGDVVLLADALGYDSRIGREFLNAGLGFGGGCLPKDIRAFMARAGELGADQALTFLREVDAINMRRRTRVVELTRELCGGSLLGQRIAVLGAAFKPESDDVRDSPALSAAAQLQLQGAVVTVTDPQALTNAAKRFPELPLEPDLETALNRADAVLLLTEWRVYRDLDPHAVKALVSVPRILDGRNVLDPAKWRAAGWIYRGLGRP
jgi:UDPglucose 6-dehydrogenase